MLNFCIAVTLSVVVAAGVQAQEQEGHNGQQARGASPAHGVRAREAHTLEQHTGERRDRLALRGHRLLHDDHARALRGAVRRPVPWHARAGREGAARLEARQAGSARDRARRRVDAHPEDPEAAAGLLQRQGAEQVDQPRRGSRVRRR